MIDIEAWFTYVDLTHEYAFRVDQGGAGVADMFTPDGIWDGSALRYGRLEGTEALRGYFEGEGGPAAMAHMFCNQQVLEVAGDTMRARAYVHGVVIREGKSEARHDIVLYDDELRRSEDGRWRFHRRAMSRQAEFRSPLPPTRLTA